MSTPAPAPDRAEVDNDLPPIGSAAPRALGEPQSLSGAGEMSGLVRSFDWPATPLGPMDRWPQSLKTSVRILLTSRFAMWMGWGPDFTFLYNDSYGRMTLGKKHPWALGKPAREVWAEIWKDIGPRIHTVMETGTATWDEALLLLLERSGYPEETYHTFSYSPLADDNGAIAGMLCVVSEETERVIGERRLISLRELASDLVSISREDAALATIERSLGRNRKDLPFTLTYLFGESGARAELACSTGIAAGHAAAPLVLDAGETKSVWPFAELLARSSVVHVDSLVERFGPLPTGIWDIPPRQAVMVPIPQQGQTRMAGFLVAGLNPYRQFDAHYAGFVDLVAGQIASSLANARAYEEERRRAAALAELDRSKTEFFSNVSHEFRTPLTLMLGPATDAIADPDTVPANRERLEVVHRNALRLLKLVNTLLDFARIEAGRLEASYEPTDVAAYTADLVSTFRSACERAGIALVADMQPLPEPVYLDHDMWEKILLNLLSNAFKHTFEGEIEVRVRAHAGHAELMVRDTGVGIAPAELTRIFDRFHRVASARSRTHEGTGIGLALVWELVRRHGGRIAVTSEEGAGTTFTVTIPFGTEHLPAGRVSRAGSARDRVASALSGVAYVEEALRWLPDLERGQDGTVAAAGEAAGADGESLDITPAIASDAPSILFADDNADMRDYVGRLLRAQGWSVEVAADGRAALEAARARRPDLVLSDIMMPRLDGFALLRALREDPQTGTIPIILLSARAGEEARVEGARAGADDYLVKPFAAQELVARVGTHLALARERAKATAAIETARAELQRIFEQAPSIVAVVRGSEHRFEMANDAYLQLIGHRDVVGKPVLDALPEVRGQGFVELLDGVLETGVPFVGREYPLQMQRTPGAPLEESFVDFTYLPIVEADGSRSGIIAHGTNVTAQVLARREVERLLRESESSRVEAEAARTEAEQANRVKSDFLAAMSHELRTPLNAIAGYIQLLEMGIHGPVTDAQREALGRVQKSEQHLLSLINDVLNFAKLEAGRVEYDIEEAPLAAVVAEVISMIESQFTAKRLACSACVAPGTVVRADREKLRQILLNLLSNAIKFTDPGGRITVGSATRDGAPAGMAFLRVSDTGIGIPRDKQEAIFDPFVQVHRKLTHSTEGTGLGLAISRDLARGMGGDLRVRSIEGKGSSFTLTLLIGDS